MAGRLESRPFPAPIAPGRTGLLFRDAEMQTPSGFEALNAQTAQAALGRERLALLRRLF